MRKTLLTAVGLALLALPACEERRGESQISQEIKDLEEAQQNVGARVQELEKQLDQSKSDVARLEDELDLARQGLTNEVLKEREELKAALQEQSEKVEERVTGAEERAEIHQTETQRALDALKQTQPPGSEGERQPVRGLEEPTEVEPEEEPAPQETEPQEPAPQETEPQTEEPAPQETEPQEPAPQETEPESKPPFEIPGRP